MTLIRIIYNGQRPRTARRTANYILHNVIPTRCTCGDTHSYKERKRLDNRLIVYSMRFPKMVKFVVAIILLASTASQSQRII